MDADLQSIQEVRNLIKKSKEAQKELATYSQKKLDYICQAIAVECSNNSEKLAKMAQEETGFGIWQDKVLKNLLGSAMTWDYIKDMKTVGALTDEPINGSWDIGVPMGIVAALIPSTNPTSTVMYKALIAIKAGNSIIFSPHPNAKKCIIETVEIIVKAAKNAGAPDGIIECITLLTPQATDCLLKHKDIGVILATGGEFMVKAAYSSGNPAIGVGPGNGPAYIEKSANINLAVKRIIDSKTFDNGTICASEQSIVTEKCISEKVILELTNQGCYFLDSEQSKKVANVIMRSNGTMNPQVVGKSVEFISKLANINIPKNTRVLISIQTQVSKNNPYSREKLCPVLGFYIEDNWEKACHRCIEILENEGVGHTMAIHSEDSAVIREFALKKPVSRLLVNTPAALGGVGATTNIAPALTLGCGAIGGSSTSDNITPMHLINIRKVVWGISELEDLRGNDAANDTSSIKSQSELSAKSFSKEDIFEITKSVLSRLSV